MATYCPNCSRKLKITDWRQNCPGCGVNLMFSDFEKHFFEDAKQSELGRARVRVWWAKVLAAFIGGKLQIIRLVSILLPVAALLVPFCSMKTEFPMYSSEVSVGVIGVINLVTKSDPMALLSLKDAPVAGTAINALLPVLASLAGALLCAVLVIVSQLISVVSDRVATILILVFSFLGFGSSAFGIYAVYRPFAVSQASMSLFTFGRGFGQFIAAAAFAVVFVLNLILKIRGYEIKFRDGDLYRVDVYRKIRRGELTLEELPYPITETEEEKAERLRAIEDTMNGKSPNEDGEVTDR